MNLSSSAPTRRRLFVAAVVVAGCSGGLSRDPLANTRKSAGGSAGAITAEGGHPLGGTTSGKSGKSGGGSGGVAGDQQVTSSGGSNRGGSGGTGSTGGSGSRGGSGTGGSGAGSIAGESGDGGGGGSVAGSGQTGGHPGTGGTAVAGEGGAAGDTGSGGSAGMGDVGPVPHDGLVYWFSADVGVTEAEGVISKWEDRSGHGAHAFQDTVELRPKLETFAGQPDLPAIVFDGTNDYLNLPAQDASFAGGVTFFCVARATRQTLGSAMLELSKGWEDDDITFLRFKGAFTYEVAGVNVRQVPEDSFTLNQPRLVDLVHTTDRQAALFINGDELETEMLSYPAGATEIDLPTFTADAPRTVNKIGHTLYTDAEPWPGEIAEMLLYSRVLSPQEQQDVRSYLSAKWKCCSD